MSFIISLEEYIAESGITEVQIPACITKILNAAIPDCVTSILIPKSVTEIESDAFADAEDLLSITVDADNPTYCDIDGVLYSKDKTELIRYPRGRKDTKFIIPDHVTKIGDGAFTHCKSLTAVILPEHITTIGYAAFQACGLTAIKFQNSLKTIGRFAFADCDGLTSVIIPDGVTEIWPRAFVGCKNLTSISFPRSVNAIYSTTFWDCITLTSVVIPDSVTEIADDAFKNCNHLTIITTQGSYADEYAHRNGFGVSYDL